MAESREEARQQLIGAVEALGFPAEFGVVLASELKSEGSLRQMCSYLWRAQPHDPADIADEMLALVGARERRAEQRRSEQANASVTRFYNRRRDDGGHAGYDEGRAAR